MLNKNIDVNAVDYLRFITHLRYFSERVIARKIAPGRQTISLSGTAETLS